ncbi:hypothetical protein OIU84_009529 [Salix udensis]|uniref:Uncharacterized protein n=1 Tax=Salix udensis TaxID=889485 RepID=A0AAD6JT62_9ROSI|nr:hypothetical protein OIU84_009529 [Salix udensis]
MASYQFLNHPNQVRDSSCFMINTTARHGFSKSQMCLQKILHIITSYPPQEISKEASLNGEILEFEENRGIDIDLNMGLSPAWGLKNDSSMEVLTADKSSSEGECCLKVVGDQFGRDSPTIQATGEEPQVVDDTAIEISKTTNFKHPANEINCKIEVTNDDQEMAKVKVEETKKEPVKVEPCHGEKNKTNKDCLDLLIEAAGMVSGNSEDKESDSDKHEETKRSRKCSLVVDLYEDNTSSPAVRSKRRRSQVLPHRYRDSSVLLEPWKRMPKPQKAETTAATAVSKKRKSG